MKRLLSIIILAQLTFLHADNYSLSFDGEAYIDISEDHPFTGNLDNFSISLWVKPTSFEGWGSVVLFRKNYLDNYLNIGDDGRIRWGLSIDGCSGCGETFADLDLDQWQHIVATYDGTNQKIYKNAVLVDANTDHSGSVDWSDECWFFIGGNPDYSASNCSGGFGGHIGNLDDIAFWDRSLDANEISSLFEGISGDEEGLIELYDFNSGDNIGSAELSADIPPTSGWNNALSFDGVDDVVEVPYSSSPLTNLNTLTLEAWVNLYSFLISRHPPDQRRSPPGRSSRPA